MRFYRHIQEAFRNLRASKLRSLLAIIGILVGTGSVVALISSSQAATDNALSQFKTLGTNLLALNLQEDPAAQAVNKVQYLQLDQLQQLMAQVPSIELAAPYVSAYSSVFFAGHKLDAQTMGATADLASINKLQMARGRFVSELDGRNYYCVIGDTLAENMKQYGVNNPIGQQIKLGSLYFTVIGVLEKTTPNMFMFADFNTTAIMPLKTSYILSQYAQIRDVMFRIKPNFSLKSVQQQIDLTLSGMLPTQRLMFRSPEQIISIMSKQRSTFTWLLVMIGSISLLVGGIGVMNIMLVSVVERRREIAIRLAIGAKQKDIRTMFLIETVTLTTFGGAIGVILGLTFSILLGYFSGWGVHIYLMPPVLGFSVSVIVGVISGFYPALKASKLNPIEILQSD